MTTRTTLFTIGTAALLFSVGCESAADQQRKADRAQAEANSEAAEARRDAEAEARRAQAEANDEIADAQEKFSKLREDFRHDLEGKLVDIDKDIAELKAQALTEKGKKKEKLDANLPIIDQRRSELNEAFRRLQEANATTWDQAKGDVEKRWNELKHSVDAAG